MKIFWSWQSDHDPKTGQYLVRDALKETAKQLVAELELEEAQRLEVDHDTKGVPGTPPIVDTIFNKIEEAIVFVADVTPVGKTDDGKKVLPNPNVMIELGYARRARGYERLILVANGHFLQKVEDLPFDMRGNRGPIMYTLAPGADAPTRKAAQKTLVDQLKGRLSDVIAFEKRERAALALGKVGVQSDQRTKWFEDGSRLEYVDAFKRHATAAVQLPAGPHSFMRIQPALWPPSVRTSNLSPGGNGASLLIGRGGSGDWGQTSEGMLSFLLFGDQGHQEVINAQMVVHWFSETGVIWAVWAEVVSDSQPPWFHGSYVMKCWGQFLERAVPLMSKVGAEGPFRVDAGVVGIRGSRWEMPKTDGALFSASDDIRRSSVDVTAELSTQHRYLASLYNRLTDAFGFQQEIAPAQVPSIIRG